MNDDDQSDYEILRAAIEATMADPDRWDGDDAEPAILARYVDGGGIRRRPTDAERQLGCREQGLTLRMVR
jgi:hypothetical protein